MDAGLRNDPALKHGLRALLERLVKDARRHLERMPREPEQAVHDLRLCMKTFSAVLRLLGKHVPRAKRRALFASAKRLRTAFSAQRDAQVSAQLAKAFGMPAALAIKACPKKSRVPLLVEVARLEKLVGKVDLSTVDWDDVTCACLKSYRTGRRLLSVCRRHPSPVNLHGWRKFVKRFYYQCLVLGCDGHGMKRRIRNARKLGHLLGHDHDLHLLLMQAAKAPEPLAMRKIAAARKSLQERIMKTGRKLYDRPARELRHLIKAGD